MKTIEQSIEEELTFLLAAFSGVRLASDFGVLRLQRIDDALFVTLNATRYDVSINVKRST